MTVLTVANSCAPQEALEGLPGVAPEALLSDPAGLALPVGIVLAPERQPRGYAELPPGADPAEEARESLRELERMVQSCEEGVYAHSLEGQILTWNRGAEKIYGYTAEEAVGMPIWRLIASEIHATVRGHFDEHKRNRSYPRVMGVGIHKDGKRISISAAITPLYTRCGRLFAVLLIVHDETLREQAEQSTAAKSEFMANLSHEIRTPMNGLIGIAGLLLDTELSAEQRRLTEMLRSSGEVLLRLINDLLDFSKIEAGKVELEHAPFDLTAVVDSLADALAAQAAGKGIELIASIDPGTPRQIVGDSGRLRQILTNLAGNALKFTSEGEVELRISAGEEQEGRRLYRFTVRDTGIGIPADQQERIFEKFTQVESANMRSYGGAGLGLAISKNLAERMGGRIGLESREGEGSTFWLKIPLEAPPCAEPALACDLALPAGQQALVVDDNAASRATLRRRLEYWGVAVVEAASGPDALRILYASLSEGRRIPIAIIDAQMPGMSGGVLAHAIRGDKLLHKTKILMMRALGQLAQRQPSEVSAAVHWINKPIHCAELYRNLVELLTRTHSKLPAPGAAPRLPAFSRSTRVLVVEDNAVNQQVALGMLRRLGVRADVAGDGAQALDMLRVVPYDLALMDMRMPIMDGLEATRRIRDPLSPVLNHAIPIVALTANAQHSDCRNCLEAGMNTFISKPIDPHALLEVLRKWLPHALEKEEAPPEEERPQEALAHEIFDGESVVRRMMGDIPLAQAVLEAFLFDMPKQLQQLRQAIGAGDLQTIGRIAHSIKGAAGNAGGGRVRRFAAEMEAAAAESNLSFLRDSAATLEARFDELRREILRVWSDWKSAPPGNEIPALQDGAGRKDKEPI